MYSLIRFSTLSSLFNTASNVYFNFAIVFFVSHVPILFSFYSIVFSSQPVVYDFLLLFHVVLLWRNSCGFHSKLLVEIDFCSSE